MIFPFIFVLLILGEMNKSTKTILLVLIICICQQVVYSQGNAWRQFRNNPQNTGYTADKGPTNPSIEKQIGLTGHVAAAPVVDSKGNVYLSCQNDTFYAFNPNLTRRWKTKLRLSFNAGNSNSHPVLSSDESTVYVYDWAEGKLNAFNAANGSLLWKSEEFIRDYGTSVPKITSGGDILLVHGDIICIGSNGATKWRNKTDQFHYWAAFSLDEKSIYVGSYNNIYTFDIAGGNPTKYQFASNLAPYPVSVDKNGRLYGAFGGALRAYQRNTNTAVWRYPCRGDQQNVTIDEVKNRVYVVNEDSIHALDFNGSIIWKKKLADVWFFGHNSPVVDGNGNIYATSQSFFGKQGILCIDWQTGNILRELKPLGAQVYSNPVIANGKVYAGIANGFVIFGERPAGSEDLSLNDRLQLHQNYPNPFRAETEISFRLSVAEHVTLRVFNVLGAEVATLLDEYRAPGIHTVKFNTGTNKAGSSVYFYQITAGSSTLLKKMMVAQ